MHGFVDGCTYQYGYETMKKFEIHQNNITVSYIYIHHLSTLFLDKGCDKSKVLGNRVVYEEKLKNKMSKKLPEVKVHHHRYPKTYNIPLTTTKKGIN